MAVTIDCDLRSMFGPVRDQGIRPTCMAFAASDAHAGVRPGWEPLSCEFAYFHALKRDGGTPSSGATLGGMLVAIKEDGQPPEPVWPYLANVPTDIALWKPPAKAKPLYRRASARGSTSIVEVVQLLDKGAPVILTMKLSDAFYRPNADGVITSTEPPDPKRRHAVVAVGHGKNGIRRVILIRNSWGPLWGIGGYAWLSEDYLAPRLYGFAEMREDLSNVSAHHTGTNVRGSVA
jgi:Papain family cysteine protease